MYFPSAWPLAQTEAKHLCNSLNIFKVLREQDERWVIYKQTAVLWACYYLNDKNILDRLVKFECWKMRERICGIHWGSNLFYLPYLLFRLRKSFKMYLQHGSDVLNTINKQHDPSLAAVQCTSMLANKSCNLYSVKLLRYLCHHFIRVSMAVFLPRTVWIVQIRLSLTMHKTAKGRSGNSCELTQFHWRQNYNELC